MLNFSPTLILFLFFSFHCGDLNTIIIASKLAVCLISAKLSSLIIFSFHHYTCIYYCNVGCGKLNISPLFKINIKFSHPQESRMESKMHDFVCV